MACRDAGLPTASFGTDEWYPFPDAIIEGHRIPYPLPGDAEKFSTIGTCPLVDHGTGKNRQRLWLKDHGVKVGGKLQYTFKLDDGVNDGP